MWGKLKETRELAPLGGAGARISVNSIDISSLEKRFGMFQGDERPSKESDTAAEAPQSRKGVVNQLLNCRRECGELENEHQHQVATHDARLYRLGGLIVGLTSQLRADALAWSEFISSPEWRDRKPPKRNGSAKRLRSTVVAASCSHRRLRGRC